MDKIKLYHSEGSPFARKVRILLIEKNLDFEPDVLNALRPITEFEAKNPAPAVPVFEHGEVTLFESNLIHEQLLETFADVPPSDEQVPPLSPWIRRPQHKWTDGKTLSVLESLRNSVVNTTFLVRYGGAVV